MAALITVHVPILVLSNKAIVVYMGGLKICHLFTETASHLYTARAYATLCCSVDDIASVRLVVHD